MQSQPLCPQCGKPAQVADAAFCPYCGAAMKPAAKAEPMPEGARALLQKARDMQNPKKKHELLEDAEKQYPDCLEIAEELLFMGRLHERDPRKLDFSVIKCYVLHMYLTPAEFTEEACAAMRQELFEHPQLKRCQELAPNAQQFTDHYLERLCSEFVELFLRGNSQYMRTFFGITLGSRAAKLLAWPTAKMMMNVRQDTELEPERREQLYRALYRGFSKQMSGETEWLDGALSEKGCFVPTDK